MAGNKNSLAHLKGKPGRATASDSHASEDEEDEDEAATESDDEDQVNDDTENEDNSENEDGNDDNDEANCASSNVEAGFALMRSADAKGREGLAAALAEDVAKGKMSANRAKELLKTSGKKSSLSVAMTGKDKSPGQDAADSKASSFTGKDASLVAMATRMKEARGGR